MKKAAISVTVELVLWRLDYCSSCLSGLPSEERGHLQLVLNTTARTATLTKKREHIKLVSKHLLWLPVKDCVDHKILLLMYNSFNGIAPWYFQQLIPHFELPRSLQSSSQSRLLIPNVDKNHAKKQFSLRALSNSVPHFWNALLQAPRESWVVPSFSPAT